MGLYRAEGLVLKTKPLGEADKLVTIFTREEGKVAATARGSRRPRSRLLALTQPFVHARYLLFSGRTLDTLSQGEIIDSFQSIRDDLDQLAYASYYCESVDQLIGENDVNQDLFLLLLLVLDLLGKGVDKELLSRYFELKLVSFLGYQPNLDACVLCGKDPAAVSQVYFDPQGGGVICSACGQRSLVLSPAALQIASQLLAGGPELLTRLRVRGSDMAALRKTMRAYIDQYLHHPLRSLAFLESWRLPNKADPKQQD